MNADFTYTNYEKFLQFHARNTHVLTRILELANELAEAGQTRLSIQMIFEVIRYENIKTVGDTFKLNNNHSAYYVRLIQAMHPVLGDMFETRSLKVAA
jgi:Txe/YoeB family toxin of Txe-Axe toxin-antitoxin module